MSTVICPNCAWENQATVLRCVHCNCKLGAATSKSQSPVASQNSSPKIMEAIYCSSCGQHIAKEAGFCPGCGAPNKAMQGKWDINTVRQMCFRRLILVIFGAQRLTSFRHEKNFCNRTLFLPCQKPKPKLGGR